MFSTLKSNILKYPVLRGMAAYSILWPASNFIQQSIDKSRDKIDIAEICRYFILGTFAVAPTVHAWVKIAGFLVKGNKFRHALAKAALDITIFSPIGQSQFYLGITLLERKPWKECVKELKNKLIPTWKVAFCFWPFIQTVNFAFVPARNRVIVISMASFTWTIILSYLHNTPKDSLPLFLRPVESVDKQESPK